MKDKLLSTVDDARKRGYPIKVALITQRYDLGAVPTLFDKPQEYARFLGFELAFLYKGPLLIAMPNGYGIFKANQPVTKELAVLKNSMPERDANAMAVAATNAVRHLAAAGGHPLPGGDVTLSSVGKKTTSNQDRLVIILAAVGAGVILGAGWFWRRRRSASV